MTAGNASACHQTVTPMPNLRNPGRASFAALHPNPLQGELCAYQDARGGCRRRTDPRQPRRAGANGRRRVHRPGAAARATGDTADQSHRTRAEAAAQAQAQAQAPAAPDTLAAWADNTKVSGTMFVDFTNIDQTSNGSKTDTSGTGLDVKRFYLSIDHQFNDIWSANLTTDFNYTSVTGETQLFVKKAYLQGAFSKLATLRVG